MHRSAPAGTASPIAPFVLAVRGVLPSRRRVTLVFGGLTALLLLIYLLAAYSPLGHARDVEVLGVSGASAAEIQLALEETARTQSPLAASEDAFMRSVAEYPEVAAVRIHAHPPLRLDLEVVMRPAVATAQIAGRTVSVAGDGTVLRRTSEASLPKLDISTSTQGLRDGRVTAGRNALALLAVAPAPLLALTQSVRAGKSGLELQLQRGPRLIFGNAEGAKSKWAAAAAVLADGSAVRASYIDLRVPARPAVGGIGGSRAAGSEPPTLTNGVVTPESGAPVTATQAPVTPQAPVTSAPQPPVQTPSTGAQSAPEQGGGQAQTPAPVTAEPSTGSAGIGGGGVAP